LLAHAGGRIYAVDDTCTHEDASLALGALKGRCIKCPLHGSRFDLETGRPLEEPADIPLKTYEVKVEGEEVYIRWP
ncbi:MAG: non-heme iron oxygenase ferredoxin subunit, partial [Gammaproteobacteria bacterium]